MKKQNVMDILRERGYLKQVVYEEDLYKLLGSESVSFYVGFDPTADSLHVGHFLALMAMSHLQQAGHKPYILIGGGTGKIGDPSGRTDMRKMMTDKTIQHHCDCFKKQMSKFFSFKGKNAAVMVNNADWLLKLNYIDFIRDIGAHFSVNKMLSAECFKSRYERGLSFLEFNYMLMQSYDFLYLFKNHNCVLQCGGDDQWSNILAGADLIRRKEQKPAYAMTFALLTTSEGLKMGKTQKGALWLDRKKTSPYEFFQYWRNVADEDVEKCLKLLTFLPLDEIEKICPKRNDKSTYKNTTFEQKINKAKERLAYEITKIVHSEKDAKEAMEKSLAAFVSFDVDKMPAKTVSGDSLQVIDIMLELKIVKSKGEARRLIKGGGVKINDKAISDELYEVDKKMLKEGFVLGKGKKVKIKVQKK